MKKIFLTGASSGIGLAIARQLCAEGHEVWGTSRDPQRIPSIPHLHALALDLSDNNLVRQSFNAALAEAGHFDVVINNAGSGHFDPAATLPAETLTLQFQILVFAQVELTQLAIKAMQQRGGLIINVTSLASRLPVPFMSAYNAAKAAMASYTMTLQAELRGSKIRVIDLQPADIRTTFNDSVSKSPTDDPTAARAWAVADHNMQNAPPPELVACRVSALIGKTNPPPQVTVGGAFQAIVAPVIFKLIPQRLRIWGLKKHYHLPT